MISSFKADTNWRNPVRFQEPFLEHVFRLTGSPRGNVFIGFSQRRARIMRAALRHRLNAQDDLAALELISKMGSSNCPFWLAKMSECRRTDGYTESQAGRQHVSAHFVNSIAVLR